MLASLLSASLHRCSSRAAASLTASCSGRLLPSIGASTTSTSAPLSSSSSSPFSTSQARATTVLCVRKGDSVCVMADGQVTRGSEVVKPNVKKVRTLAGGAAIGGFAGATADAFTLFERLETQLEAHPGQLTRAAVELAKLWRTDKYLRRLDAVMVVADAKVSLSISGGGDVLEPHDGVLAIGSGSPYALAAARALLDSPSLSAREVCERAMRIAADACIYTNDNFTIEELKIEGGGAGGGGGEGGEKEEEGASAAASKKDKENRKEKK